MTRALTSTNILSPSSERYFGMHPIDLMARVDFLLIISLMWLLSGKLLSIITPTFLAFFVMLISVPAKCDAVTKGFESVSCHLLIATTDGKDGHRL